MNFEELHNELNNFPEDLKYSEARWDEALAVIEAHEAKVATLKKAGALVSVVALISCVFVFYPFHSEQISEYSPRELNSIGIDNFRDDSGTQSKAEPKESYITNGPISYPEETTKEHISAEMMASNVDETQNTLGKRTGEELSKENIERRALEKTTTSIDIKVNEAERSHSTEIDITQSDAKNSLDSGVVADQNPAGENESEEPKLDLKTQEDKISVDLNTIKLDDTKTPATEAMSVMNHNSDLFLNPSHIESSEKFIPSVSRLTQRNSYLMFNLPRKRLSSDKKIVGGDKTFKIYREFIGGKVGVNLLAHYGRTDMFGGTNPSVGLFYENAISEKVFWNAGLEYFNISSIYLPVSSEETSYNYGFESNVHTVHTDRAHFMSAPFYIGVRPFNRVQLKAGGSVNVLIETQNTLEERHVTNDSSTLLNQSSTRGYRTSFNSLGFTAAASMNYWISERTSLQFTYHYGLSDFSKNEVFDSQKVNENSRFEVSINKVLK